MPSTRAASDGRYDIGLAVSLLNMILVRPLCQYIAVSSLIPPLYIEKGNQQIILVAEWKPDTSDVISGHC